MLIVGLVVVVPYFVSFLDDSRQVAEITWEIYGIAARCRNLGVQGRDGAALLMSCFWFAFLLARILRPVPCVLVGTEFAIGWLHYPFLAGELCKSRELGYSSTEFARLVVSM